MPEQAGAGMLLLGIDTCGAVGSLALARVAGAGSLALLASAALAGRTTAAELVPALQAMLAQAGTQIKALDAFVVVDGPGSFTGIRIGVSTAKALAEATGRPLFAVSKLAVLRGAHGAQAAVLDAGRGELYYGTGEQELLLTREELAARLLLGVVTVVCEERVAAVFRDAHVVGSPSAWDALQAVLPALEAAHSVDVAALDARYIRREDLYRTQPRAVPVA